MWTAIGAQAILRFDEDAYDEFSGDRRHKSQFQLSESADARDASGASLTDLVQSVESADADDVVPVEHWAKVAHTLAAWRPTGYAHDADSEIESSI